MVWAYYFNKETMTLQEIAKKYKAEWFYCELYWVNYYIVIAKWDKYLKIQQDINDNLWEINISDSNWKCIWFEWDFMIILRNKNELTFTHELIHLVFDLFDERWIPTNNDNQEVFAYYYSYLFTKFKTLIK